jgi:hypothetical protein
VHTDSGSLEYHREVAGPAVRRGADAGLITLSSIRVYGEPSEKAVSQLHEKARLLGCSDVTVHALHAGFGRFGAAEGGSG